MRRPQLDKATSIKVVKKNGNNYIQILKTDKSDKNFNKGLKKLTKGVKVDVCDNVVKVDLTITLEYGFNIPKTCQKVQDKVKTAIETMTGLTVSDVNIRIASVKM